MELMEKETMRSEAAQSRRDLLIARALTVGKEKLVEQANPRRSYLRWMLNRSLGELVLRQWG